MKKLLIVATVLAGTAFLAMPETASADHCRYDGYRRSYYRGGYGYRYRPSYSYRSYGYRGYGRPYRYGYSRFGYGYRPYYGYRGYGRGSGFFYRGRNFSFGFSR